MSAATFCESCLEPGYRVESTCLGPRQAPEGTPLYLWEAGLLCDPCADKLIAREAAKEAAGPLYRLLHDAVAAGDVGLLVDLAQRWEGTRAPEAKS